MSAEIISLAGIERPAFRNGTPVVTLDGRRGTVRRRHFAVSPAGGSVLLEYEVQLFGGRGALAVAPDKLRALDPRYVSDASAPAGGAA
jgi:hypothetical protein